MDSDLDGMMERAKSRVLGRGEQPVHLEELPEKSSITEYIRNRRKAIRAFNPQYTDQEDGYALRRERRKASLKKHNKPGRKRGRKY